MKHLAILSVVVTALCLAACGGKTAGTADPDSLFYADTVAVEEDTNPPVDTIPEEDSLLVDSQLNI